jgi:DNA-binding IclR family transcriptional regulator
MNPLSKVFSIIEAVVARQATGTSYSEIVSAVRLPKSTVHRILKDLRELDYISFDPETKRYSGSLRLAQIGYEVITNFQLVNHVRPFLLDLNRETEHTTQFGILDGTVGVYVDKIESKDFGIKLFSEIGKTFPLHCTGLGKSLLAFSPEDTVARIFKQKLEPITAKTITDPKKLKRELVLITERGYAVDHEEITRGIMCTAAPVFGFSGELAGAISVTFPAYINDDRGIEPEIESVKKYAALISRSLGGR